MAKVYKNNKNFLIIQMTGEEASSLGFGIKATGRLNSIICGSCNAFIEHKDIYYIAGINEVLCEDCVNDYVKNMSYHTDDDSLRYEINHFNVIANKLNMGVQASKTPNNKVVISDN